MLNATSLLNKPDSSIKGHDVMPRANYPAPEPELRENEEAMFRDQFSYLMIALNAVQAAVFTHAMARIAWLCNKVAELTLSVNMQRTAALCITRSSCR